MKIGIDARTILNPEKSEGIGVGHYTYQFLRHLLEEDTSNEYIFFFDYRVREKDIKKFTNKNAKVRFYPFSDYKKYLPGAYNEILGRATLMKENLDILHSTSPLSRIPWGYSGKTVTTFHNLGVLACPDSYSRLRRTKEQAVIKYMAKKSDRIIAVSTSIKEDLKKLFGTSEEKVRVVYGGIDKRFFEMPHTTGEKILTRFGIRKPYILYLGTLSPVNNVTRFLEAFTEFKKQYLQRTKKKHLPYQLVLAGKRGWLSQEYRQVIKDFGLTKDLVFTGYVIGDELVPLFRNAEFFVMPSLYEGFGSTVLEAFATETPVIASRVSSLPEIAGDAAYFIDPINIQEIAEAMLAFAENPEMREEYRKKGLEQAKQYSWKRAAQETIKVYEELHNSPNAQII